ncbi:MAG: hypothetical protein RLZZ584_1104 [Pseudomonadota bacterium]
MSTPAPSTQHAAGEAPGQTPGAVPGAVPGQAPGPAPATVWAPLLPMAMVGINRPGLALPAWPGEIGRLIALAVAGSDGNAATGMLRAAAVLATCGAAGAQGRPWPHALPAPAPADSLPAWPEGAALPDIAWAMHDGPARLAPLVFVALAQAGRRLPAALLPQALELGRRALALRPLLAPVLGERGRWLAARRTEWRYAADGAADGSTGDPPLPRHWQDGSLAQRLALLRRERASDPAAARTRLAAALPGLPAKERAEFTAVLADGLGQADEALLDQLRADRSREVRQAACDLLLRLPGAAHPQRAAARVAALLGRERTLLLRQRWVIAAPGAAGPDWKADNIDPVRPGHDSLGERAWWLYQLVRQVPLGWWTGQLGLDPAGLLTWARGTDWAEALLRGWRDVLLAAPDPAWCEAWLDAWPADLLRDDPAVVLALLPPVARERHWLRQLRASAVPLHASVQQILAAVPPGELLGAPLSAALAQALAVALAPGRAGAEHLLRTSLPELCAVLDPAALDRLASCPDSADAPPSWAATRHTVTQVVAVRRALLQLPPTRTP